MYFVNLRRKIGDMVRPAQIESTPFQLFSCLKCCGNVGVVHAYTHTHTPTGHTSAMRMNLEKRRARSLRRSSERMLLATKYDSVLNRSANCTTFGAMCFSLGLFHACRRSSEGCVRVRAGAGAGEGASYADLAVQFEVVEGQLPRDLLVVDVPQLQCGREDVLRHLQVPKVSTRREKRRRSEKKNRYSGKEADLRIGELS